jgi:hypothetical protein
MVVSHIVSQRHKYRRTNIRPYLNKYTPKNFETQTQWVNCLKVSIESAAPIRQIPCFAVIRRRKSYQTATAQPR